LYASAHGDVAITFERDEELRRQIAYLLGRLG
jgi:hypothetical protein